MFTSTLMKVKSGVSSGRMSNDYINIREDKFHKKKTLGKKFSN